MVSTQMPYKDQRFWRRVILRRAVRSPSFQQRVDTGSRMDEVIFEEFKGTGNSEIILDRKVSDKRVFPSMDILRSGTRKEELLIGDGTLKKMFVCAVF